MWLDAERCEITVLDVLRFARGVTKKTTPKRGFAVISCRLFGETVFECNGEQTYASPQNFVLIPADVAYKQSSSEEEIICIHLKMSGLQSEGILGFHCTSPHLKRCFLSLYHVWKTKEKGYMLKCKSMICDILFELLALKGSDALLESRSVIEPAVQYIRKHCLEGDFSLSCAIAQSYVSPAYFRRVFKVAYEMKPACFVNSLRIDHAKSLLAGSGLGMREIAEQSGFQGEKYFFSVFKKIAGTTPLEWRRTHT